MNSHSVDLLIVGGGTGGCAAALAACRHGLRVLMTEPCEWIGGQLTSQAVPPDEHRWIEMHGGTDSYENFRDAVRAYYRQHYPLTSQARNTRNLNPGEGWVSRICHEPKVSHAILLQMLAPYSSMGRLQILRGVEPIRAELEGDQVKAVEFRELREGSEFRAEAPIVLDATECGDLLPLCEAEYVSGAESKADTGEPHAVEGPAQPDNVQAITWCFAMGYDSRPGASYVGSAPEGYERWRGYTPELNPPWPAPLFSWTDPLPWTLEARSNTLFPKEREGMEAPGTSFWDYRRLVHAAHWDAAQQPEECSLVNWPMNDYMEANLLSNDPAERERAMKESKQLSRCFFHWLQTEAPNRLTGGQGYPGLYLKGDPVGTNDGFAQYPYVRESRRMLTRFRVLEQHVGTEARTGIKRIPKIQDPPELIGQRAEAFADSVGIGQYRIDLHMTTGGDNYIDISTFPFQIPLGALIPVRMRNLLPACKNIGSTHLTNGCYRLHPVEWNIGESVGELAAYCLANKLEAAQVYESPEHLSAFQEQLSRSGIRIEWPQPHPV